MMESARVDASAFATARGRPDQADLEYISGLLGKYRAAQVARMSGRSLALVRAVSELGILPPPRSVFRLVDPAPPVPPQSLAPSGNRRAQPWRRTLPPAARQTIELAAWRHGVPVEALFGPSRKAVICAARHEAMCAVHDLGRFSYPLIGSWFGGRDHTTVLYAVRKRDARRALVAA